MLKKQFRFDFKGKIGLKDNSYLIISHEPPLNKGEVSVAISHNEDAKKRKDALSNLSDLVLNVHKSVRLSRWDYHDAILVETQNFDGGLGVLMSSRLETQGIVPQGSTGLLKRKLKEEGHILLEDNIALGTKGSEEKAKPKLLGLFRFRKRGRER